MNTNRSHAVVAVLLLFSLLFCPAAFCGKFFEDGQIHSASKDGDLEKVKVLIKKNPDLVRDADAYGWTPLHWAAYQGHKVVVEFLLANKADVNGKVKSGSTPLHVAALNGRKDVAELLLANGADINAEDNNGRTPLAMALERRLEKVNVTTPSELRSLDETIALLRKHGGKE